MKPTRHNRPWILGAGILVIVLMPVVAFAGHELAGATTDTAVVVDFQYPNGVLGRIAKEFIEAFNTGDEDTITVFFTTHESDSALVRRPLEDQLYNYRSLFRVLGNIAPHSVLERSDTKIVLLVKSEKLKAWFKVGLELEKDSPEKLSRLFVRPAPPPDAVEKS